MSVSSAEIDAALDLLAPVGELSHRRMMGGLSIYSHGVIFAILSSDGTLYLKAEGAFADALAAEGSEQFAMTRKDGSVGRMGYWTLPPEALDDPDAVVALAREALERLG